MYDERQTAGVLPSCSAVATIALRMRRFLSALLGACPCIASAMEQSSVPAQVRKSFAVKSGPTIDWM